MVVGMVAPPSGSGTQVPSFVEKRRDLPRMMEHLVPVCHTTWIPIGGSCKLESKTTLIHAYSTTPEIVALSLCSATHPETCVGCERRASDVLCLPCFNALPRVAAPSADVAGFRPPSRRSYARSARTSTSVSRAPERP